MKNKKEFSLKSFIVNITIVQMVITYFVLILGNIGIALDFTEIISRYIPVALVAFFGTFLFYKFGVKKLHKSDSKTVKTLGFLVPLGIAILIFAFGIYSVNSNIKDAKKEVDKNLMSIMYKNVYGEEEYNKHVEEAILEAKDKAIKMWSICSIVYAVFGELAAIITLRNLEEKMLGDEDLQVSDNMSYRVINTGENNQNETMNLTGTPPINQNDSNNINWNL